MGKLLCHKTQFEIEFLNKFFSSGLQEGLPPYSACSSLQKAGPACCFLASRTTEITKSRAPN